MPIADLFEPGKFHEPKKAKVKSPTQRTQNRREKWEDAVNPDLYENTLFKCGDKWDKDFSGPTKIKPGPDKVAIFEARYANRTPLWRKDDADCHPVDMNDYHGFTIALGDIMKGNATGIELIADLGMRKKPWRAHPWDPEAGSEGQGAHVHLGYYERWEQANLAVRLWNAARGEVETDSIDCSKWAPENISDEVIARLTEKDIRRIASGYGSNK